MVDLRLRGACGINGVTPQTQAQARGKAGRRGRSKVNGMSISFCFVLAGKKIGGGKALEFQTAAERNKEVSPFLL